MRRQLPQTPILTLGDVKNVAGLDMDLSKNGKQDIILWYEDGQARMLLRIGEEVPPVFIALDADSNPTAISALPDDGR